MCFVLFRATSLKTLTGSRAHPLREEICSAGVASRDGTANGRPAIRVVNRVCVRAEDPLRAEPDADGGAAALACRKEPVSQALFDCSHTFVILRRRERRYQFWRSMSAGADRACQHAADNLSSSPAAFTEFVSASSVTTPIVLASPRLGANSKSRWQAAHDGPNM